MQRCEYKPLTIITKSSILDAAAILDPPLDMEIEKNPWNNLKKKK